MPKPRKMLRYQNAPCINALMKLIETQSKTTLANWAIDYSEQVLLPLWLKHYPHDPRPKSALKAARRWLKGEIKLPEAKRAILLCHAAAREAEENPAARAAARGIAQSASTIHSARHSLGLALYGALAVAYEKLGPAAPWEQIEQTAADECGKMHAALQAISVKDEPNPAKIYRKFI